MKKSYILIIIWLITANVLSAASESHVYVLVHGAWHGNWTYYKLKYELEKAGHTAICVNLPGHGLDSVNAGTVTLTDYQNAVVNVLDTLDEPVVLVGHSMGGIVISMVAEARPDKIDKLVYLAAFMPQNNQSMLELALMDSLSTIGPNLVFDFANNVVGINKNKISDIFYDESTEEFVLLSEMLITPNPLQPLVTPLTLTEDNYGSVRKFYITTTYDKAITPDFQEEMYSVQNCEDIYSMNTAHSPFFSAPDNLKNILDKIGDDDKVQENLKSPDPFLEKTTDETNIAVQILADKYIRVTSNKTINTCNLKVYSFSGSLLKDITVTPFSNSFEANLNGIRENFILVIITADGKTISRSLRLF